MLQVHPFGPRGAHSAACLDNRAAGLELATPPYSVSMDAQSISSVCYTCPLLARVRTALEVITNDPAMCCTV